MLEIKIGVQLASLHLPFKQALLTAARLGARGVEIDGRSGVRPEEMSRTAVRQIRKMLEDLNLRVCAVGFRTQRGYNVRDGLDQRVEATKQAMKMAYELGAGIVTNQVGRIPAEPVGLEWELLIETLSDLGRYGQHIGAVLAAVTGSESGSTMAKLIAALPTGAICVALNPGNLIVNGFSPHEAVQTLGAHILYVYAKDGVRDLAQGRGLEVPLGRGTAEFPELLGKLEEHQYRGYLTIERENAQDPVTEVGHAIEYLKNI